MLCWCVFFVVFEWVFSLKNILCMGIYWMVFWSVDCVKWVDYGVKFAVNIEVFVELDCIIFLRDGIDWVDL